MTAKQYTIRQDRASGYSAALNSVLRTAKPCAACAISTEARMTCLPVRMPKGASRRARVPLKNGSSSPSCRQPRLGRRAGSTVDAVEPNQLPSRTWEARGTAARGRTRAAATACVTNTARSHRHPPAPSCTACPKSQLVCAPFPSSSPAPKPGPTPLALRWGAQYVGVIAVWLSTCTQQGRHAGQLELSTCT